MHICGHNKYGSLDISSAHDYAHWISLSVTSIMHRQMVRASISDQASPRLMAVLKYITLFSSSPSSNSHFYVGSIYVDIRLRVAQSYTSSADIPFSLISSFTLSNHLLLSVPLFLLPCTFISFVLLPI